MSFPCPIPRRYGFPGILSLLFLYSATGAAATSPPTALTATVVGGTVTLKWVAPRAVTGFSPVKGYRLFRRALGSDREVIVNGSTALFYSDSNLTLGTYTYALKAIGNDDTVSTAVRTDPLLVSDIQAPLAPATSSAKGTSTSTIDLSWAKATDNIGVTKYEIYRNGSYLATVPAPLATVATVATVGHTDQNLPSSTAYTYTVRAVDATGLTSGWSPQAVGNTLAHLTTVTLSLNSDTPLAGTMLQMRASATDGDGNLTELKICEVLSSGDVCHSVAKGPNSNLQGSKDTPVSDLVPRNYYAMVNDAAGGTAKTSIYKADGKAHLYVADTGSDSDIPVKRGSEALPLKTITEAIKRAPTTTTTTTVTYIAVKGKFTERVIINKSNITLDGQKSTTVLAPDNDNVKSNPGAINVVGVLLN